MSICDYIVSCCNSPRGLKTELPMFFIPESDGGTATDRNHIDNLFVWIRFINDNKKFYNFESNEAIILLNDDKTWLLYHI